MIVSVYDAKGRTAKMQQAAQLPMIEQAEVTEKRNKVNFPFGDAEMAHLSFAGIDIKYGDIALREQVNLHMNMDDVPPAIELHFTLSGNGFLQNDRNGDRYNFEAGFCNMHYLPYFTGAGEYHKEARFKFFEVHFSTAAFMALAENSSPLLRDFAEKISGNSRIEINKENMPITPAMHHCIQDIIHCRFSGGLKVMYLQSKCIELLALQAQAYESFTGKTPFPFPITAGDIERIRYAQSYLLRHSVQPPSLTELSRIAGINEFKLKKGFKEVFNNTVFGYLADHKLNEAREMLIYRQLPIKEVADQLGYSSVQHFTRAFKKKFGVAPGQAKG